MPILPNAMLNLSCLGLLYIKNNYNALHFIIVYDFLMLTYHLYTIYLNFSRSIVLMQMYSIMYIGVSEMYM